MTNRIVEVTAAQEREHLEVRLYVLALIALARQLEGQSAGPESHPVTPPEVKRA